MKKTLDRSVILVCGHKDSKLKKKKSVVGLVMNSKSKKQKREPLVKAFQSPFGDIPVFFVERSAISQAFKDALTVKQVPVLSHIKMKQNGGPTRGFSALIKKTEQDPLSQTKGVSPIGDEFYFAKGIPVLEVIDTLIKDGSVSEKDAIMYSGYISWIKEKLEEEIDNGSFIKIKCSEKLIWELTQREDTSPEDVWNFLVTKLGGEYKQWPILPKE
jgi:putative AlgH/UPF0301 family transcriptional regulator